MKWINRKRKSLEIQSDDFPHITILLAVYNEEEVIAQKIETTFKTNYPKNKIKLIIGSDCSTDSTNAIIAKYAANDDRIALVAFKQRTGKPEIINELFKHVTTSIIVLTDADTFFSEQLLVELIAPFSMPQVGGVQAMLVPSIRDPKAEIGLEELVYLKGEMNIKKGESKWGMVMGAHGACYAIRTELYKPVPLGFLVDDFFIFSNVLLHGFKTIFAEKAIVSMPIDIQSKVQFKRKIRISNGNFQNLIALISLLNPFYFKRFYVYLSHKVLKWSGPFLLTFIALFTFFNRFKNEFYNYFFWVQMLLLTLGVLDLLYRRLTKKKSWFTFIGHFLSMNIAVGIGFFKYLFYKKANGAWNNR